MPVGGGADPAGGHGVLEVDAPHVEAGRGLLGAEQPAGGEVVVDGQALDVDQGQALEAAGVDGAGGGGGQQLVAAPSEALRGVPHVDARGHPVPALGDQGSYSHSSRPDQKPHRGGCLERRVL